MWEHKLGVMLSRGHCLLWAAIVGIAGIQMEAESQTLAPATFLLSSVVASPVYQLDNIVELQQAPASYLLVAPGWSNNGRKVSYVTGNFSVGISAFLTELQSGAVPTEIVPLSESLQDVWGHGFSSDGRHFLYRSGAPGSEGLARIAIDGTGTIDHNILSLSVLDAQTAPSLISLQNWSLQKVGAITKMVVCLRTVASPGDPTGPWQNFAVYLLDVDNTGLPVSSSSAMLLSIRLPESFALLDLQLSPSGNEMSFGIMEGNNINLNQYVLLNLLDIVTGTALPANSLSDARVAGVGITSQWEGVTTWSQDGSLIFYEIDFEGGFDNSTWTFTNTDFDIVIVSLEDIRHGHPNPQRLIQAGNQAVVTASPGGTRLAFISGAVAPDKLVAASLRVTDSVQLDGSGVSQGDFTLRDGSGCTLSIPSGTTCGNMGTGPQDIWVFTPISPVEEAQLGADVAGVPVVRDFGPAGATFSPAAQLTISYTNDETYGLAEAELAPYKYNNASGAFDLPLTVVSRNLDANTITVELATFGSPGGARKSGSGRGAIGLGAKVDSDHDGMSDSTENVLGTNPQLVDTDHDGLTDYQEVYRDGNAALNAYDPASNPTGTDTNPLVYDTDGDGFSDGAEVSQGHSPIDPADAPPPMPATNWMGLGLLVALLVGVVCFRKNVSGKAVA